MLGVWNGRVMEKGSISALPRQMAARCSTSTLGEMRECYGRTGKGALVGELGASLRQMAAILRSARESATAMFGWSKVSEQRLRGESKLRPAAGRANDPRLWEAILDRYPWDRQTPFLPVS